MLITINIIVSTCHYHRCRNQKPIRNENTMHDFAVVHIVSILSGDKLSVIWGVSSFPYQHGHNWEECTHLGGWIRHVQTHLKSPQYLACSISPRPTISIYIQNNCGLGMVKPPWSHHGFLIESTIPGAPNIKSSVPLRMRYAAGTPRMGCRRPCLVTNPPKNECSNLHPIQNGHVQHSIPQKMLNIPWRPGNDEETLQLCYILLYNSLGNRNSWCQKRTASIH